MSTKKRNREQIILDGAKKRAKETLINELKERGLTIEDAKKNKELWGEVQQHHQRLTQQIFNESKNATSRASMELTQGVFVLTYSVGGQDLQWKTLEKRKIDKAQKESSKRIRQSSEKTNSQNTRNLNWNDLNQQITANFTLRELIGNSNPPTTTQQRENLIRIAETAQRIRDEWGSGIAITSGFRDPEHNRKVGGVPNSQHITGNALDIRPVNGNIEQFHAWLYENRDRLGISGFGHGQHRGFVHIDLGPRREWRY